MSDLSDQEFLARLEQHSEQFQTWRARRTAARSKLIELGLTGDEVDAVLDGPSWKVGEQTK